MNLYLPSCSVIPVLSVWVLNGSPRDKRISCADAGVSLWFLEANSSTVLCFTDCFRDVQLII